MKLILDLIVSLIGIILSFPFCLAIAVVIKLEDGEPIFYLQKRCGIRCKPFKIIKFRSMIVGAEKDRAIMAVENDSRSTKIGKFLRATAMDELPQLINILKGDISFVGPRPERPELVEEFLKTVDNYGSRFAVKPGLTGVAQILGKYDSPPDVKLKYDLWYIKHQNFWLDIYLIFLSFLITFIGKWETRGEKLGKLLDSFKSNIDKEIGIKNA